MTALIRFWTGDEWQEYIQQLLKRRYPLGQYQEVPDTDRGDFGLEGFSRSDGCVYQCYAAQEPKTTLQLYESQRDKITTDINKFITNKIELEVLFSPTKISRWILMVPRFESSKLLLHAARKAEEVRNANLSYTTNDFAILVKNDSYFEVEMSTLARAGLIRLPIPAAVVGNDEVDSWASRDENISLVNQLRIKTGKLPNLRTAETRAKFNAEIIKQFLQGQITLSELHTHFPDVHEEVLNCKNARQNLLAMASFTSSGNPTEQLVEAIEKYKADLSRIPGIPEQTVEVLVYEAVSDWLMRCPLDFVGG